jgi:hypothetical protein
VAQAATVFAGDERTQRAEQRIAELERLVGRLTLELELAKKAMSANFGGPVFSEWPGLFVVGGRFLTRENGVFRPLRGGHNPPSARSRAS